TMINKRQSEYYEAIRESTHKGESTAFIQFILETIYEATTQFTKNIRPTKQSAQLRINAARQNFLKKTFRRKEYLSICPGISPQLATKDLALAVGQGLLIKSGDNINTKYRFKDT
ncbi:MAG: Fic family protein, partial [Candidatus Omnitrophota bacterium]